MRGERGVCDEWEEGKGLCDKEKENTYVIGFVIINIGKLERAD